MFPPYYIFPYFEYAFVPSYRRPTVTPLPEYKEPTQEDDDVILLAYYYMTRYNYGK